MILNLPRHVADRFEFIVDEQLRSHHDKPKDVHKSSEGRKDKGVPALMLLIQEGVDSITNDLKTRKSIEK